MSDVYQRYVPKGQETYTSPLLPRVEAVCKIFDSTFDIGDYDVKFDRLVNLIREGNPDNEGVIEDLKYSMPSHIFDAASYIIESEDAALCDVDVGTRWYDLRPHKKQHEFFTSTNRFCVVPAGRRSGKTEIAKRRIVTRAISESKYDDAWFVAGAPTYNQAKRIWWRDLKALSPKWLVDGTPSESELTIRYVNGAEISVMGMDKPERVEGRSLNGIALDEFANMSERTWGAHVRPALSDRLGWADIIGVPEGRNHYYDMCQRAEADETNEWFYRTWFSSTVLPESEIEAAKASLDPLTYKQEYEASFVTFQGLAYYTYDESKHLASLEYNPNQDLIFAFDFNVAPGVAAIMQEGPRGTEVIGEVYIEKGSNTLRVCERLKNDWGHHQGRVLIYGDATGGAKGSAKVKGSDWDLVRQSLGVCFGDRLRFRIPKANPRERARLNAFNTRLLRGDGVINMRIDPGKAPHVVRDLEGVRQKDDGSLDKTYDLKLTHISDAIGYYVARRFPISASFTSSNTSAF